ncbi:sensor histidine kinase [Aeromicrobium halocynthiae]|uniref:Sensor histidine kinase n=1 Tax=Aeromicrobium halocynthiae TaxID=560557 RepID=A0ABN2VZ04_9ACTN
MTAASLETQAAVEPGPASVTASDAGARDPWERWGWVMGAIWLVFLGFPLREVAQVAAPGPVKAAAATAIVVFAAVYVAGLWGMDRRSGPADVHRFSTRVLVLLLLIAVVPAWVIGVEALGLMAFVVSFAMFGLSLRAAAAVSALALLVTALTPVVAGSAEEHWFFTVIVGLVLVSTAMVRVLEERGAEHRAMARHVDLVSERERVARDVHDVLGHSLTVITVKSELAQRLVEDDPARAKAELDDIRRLTRTALAEIRATVAGLRVARLDEELTAASVALHGAGLAADLPEDPEVADPRHRILLAWVLREAVTNVVRHSGARHCVIHLGSTSLVVTDDGAGLGDASEGNGLRGIRERVAAAGGRLVVGPGDLVEGARGVGTRVEVTL